MPRLIKAEETLKAVQKALETDPTQKFQLVFRLAAPTYLKVLEDAIETGQPIGHQVADSVAGFYDLRDKAGKLQLGPTEADLLKSLTTFWRCSPEEAIRRLIEKAAFAILEQEIDEQEEQRKQLNRLTSRS